MSTPEIVALILGTNGLSALAPLLLSRWVNRAANKKAGQDGAQAIAVAAVTLVAPLEARVSKLETQQSLAVAYIRDLWAWIDRHMPGRKPPAPPEGLHLT